MPKQTITICDTEVEVEYTYKEWYEQHPYGATTATEHMCECEVVSVNYKGEQFIIDDFLRDEVNEILTQYLIDHHDDN